MLLRDSQNRIQSMALVYNKLYQSQNLASINMTDYVNELTAGLIKSYAFNPNKVTVSTVSSDVYLAVDMAIPCGLVINELVTNSLKYAFPENKTGKIAVSLTEDAHQALELVVSDNGVGIPVIFLTAFVDEKTLDRAKLTAPCGYLTKPFEENDLRIAIEVGLYRAKLESERETLIKELQEAIAKIKTLSGLIPICAWCKKIRDDQGYWQTEEQYIKEHSPAEFTHSICPDCQKKYFPEINT